MIDSLVYIGGGYLIPPLVTLDEVEDFFDCCQRWGQQAEVIASGCYNITANKAPMTFLELKKAKEQGEDKS